MCKDSKSLWSKLRCLLQPAADKTSTYQHSAEEFAQHFHNKVSAIRASTANAPSPSIVDRVVPEPLSVFEPVTAAEVSSILVKSPAKHCVLDPIPTWLLKKVSTVLSPVIARMCNASISQSSLPSSQKCARTRPLLKKPSLDPSNLNSYRPISNLTFISKTLERLIDARFTKHADKHSLFPVNQSAYRKYHSTETAVVRIYNDLINAVDLGHVGALVLLDLSSAFDTVDHQVMLNVLHQRFGVCDAALTGSRHTSMDEHKFSHLHQKCPQCDR